MTAERTVLVTGGAGFVGSHLIEALVREPGTRVISLDNYSTGSETNHIEGAEYRRGHTKAISACIPEKPDLVYHLGEYARVEKSFEEMPRVWDFNIVGTHEVIEFCYRRRAKLIYAGSSTKFADGGLGRDQSPYAWTKATNTELVRNYGAWYGLDYAITYFYNVYGGREMGGGDYATVIGIFKGKHERGEPLTVVSPGTQQRNFTHVDDIVAGLLLVGARGHGDDYGLGADESYSILDVAKMFGGEIEMLPERKGNRMDGKPGVSRARLELDWKPTRKLADYIAAAN